MVTLLVAFAATGCSALLELDHHVATRDDASDASNVVDASATDAISDAIDAPPDMGDAPVLDGGPAAPFCDQDAGWRYCDSFDLGTGLSANWSTEYLDGGATVGIGTQVAFSPPQALFSTTPNATPSAYAYAYAWRDTTINSTVTEVDLVLQMNLRSIGAGGQNDLIHLVFAKGAYVFTVGVGANADAYALEKQWNDAGATTSTFTTPLLGKVPLSTWQKFDVRLVFKPTPHFNVRIDGVPSSGDLPFMIAPTFGTNLKLEVGLPYSEGKWTVLVDDLALRVVL
jgi:hypothetical protein